jgi:ABC-2 type transport system ATP-binding protein
LHDVSFEIERGSFFGLAGVNGAGKTTLIKCVLDLASSSSGSIEIFDIPSNLARARTRLSYLPERFNPPYYLNGRDFLRMMAGMRGNRYDEGAATRMLAALDLDPSTLGRTVKAYSKGMTQKLGLASCFLADCELTILDEPMSGLDPMARACVKRLLQGLKADGRTLFFTSHALADIEEICETVGVLHQGSMRFIGAPASLRARAGDATLEDAFLKLIAGPETMPG